MDTVDAGTRIAEAERIVNGYLGWSSGAGLIPIPGLDLAGIFAVQLKMLDDLSKLYEVPFSKNLAKELVGTLIGSGGAVALTVPATSLIKFVPFIGHLASVFTEPAAAAAATYALGRVFIVHFESGGTFLDFNPTEVAKFYNEQMAAARAGKSTPTTPKPA